MASKYVSHPAYKRLRSVRPAKVYAIVDGEAKPLKVGQGRAKWERCIETATRLGAEGLQLHDEDGNVVDVVELVEREEELATDDKTVGRVEHLVALALDAADRAVSRNLEQQQQVLDASLTIMKAAVDRTNALEKVVANMVRQHERFLSSTTPEGKSGITMDDILALFGAATQAGLIDPAKLVGLIGPMNGSGSNGAGA